MAIRLPSDARTAMVVTMVFSGVIGAAAGAVGGSIAASTFYAHQWERMSAAVSYDSKALQKEADDVARYGRVVRPWLGVEYSMGEKGAQIEPQEGSVFSESPAAKAGLKPGDLITAVENKPLTLQFTLSDAIMEFMPGDTVTLHVLRADKKLVLEATLREPPQTLP